MSLSVEDEKFLNLISTNTLINEAGHLEMPLPFKNVFSFPCNKDQVCRRQQGTLLRLKRDKHKFSESLAFMQKLMDAGHVERIPTVELNRSDGRVWYLPIFPVVHPKKGKVRLVFDSAASYFGESLNSNLLTGPDQNNLLLGLLLRFREKEVAFMADIESMYHCFHVPKEHRDAMRFFWFENNDGSKRLVQYRAKVHIFGNCSSPSVAILGLHKAAESLKSTHNGSSSNCEAAAYNYITRSFYVDDGLGCTSTVQEAIQVIKTAKEALQRFNIRLHKMLSNCNEVIEAFPESERAETKIVAEIGSNPSAFHRTLGVAWNIKQDCFTLHSNIPSRPFTKRGILTVINSLFDPIGMACPVVLRGKLLQRNIMLPTNSSTVSGYDWDEELPQLWHNQWLDWLSSLRHLPSIQLPRCLIPKNFGKIVDRTLHVFSDASNEAIGYVIYQKVVNINGSIHVAFVMGGSKVAPRGASSIPRLELCAAVEASQAGNYAKRQLNETISHMYFYSDSKVTLAYIKNESKRFTKYVSRRAHIIRNSTEPNDWYFVNTKDNPADLATRPVHAKSLATSCWFSGPKSLWHHPTKNNENIELPDDLPETKSLPDDFSALVTTSENGHLFNNLFLKVSNWSRLLKIVTFVVSFTWKMMNKLRLKKGESNNKSDLSPRRTAQRFLIREAQSECLRASHKNCTRDHLLSKFESLNPFFDQEGILRVGGRLKKANLPTDVKHPILLPKAHKITMLIVNHYHQRCQHQGRHITHGTIRNAGFFIENGGKVIKQLIKNCVICMKLRKSCEEQFMADLPPDRVNPAPPFLHTGLDVMGPWKVRDGVTTRRNSAERKAWAVLFTCLASRAVHIELITSLDTSSMKNALSRFFALRGRCALLRSDRGTNFIGACGEIDMQQVSSSIERSECRWEFNAPHASHHGGAWERKIGQIKRILDAALIQMGTRYLTQDELNTLFQEAAAIVNSTPLWKVSADPNDPQPLSPMMLLTMKNSDFINNSNYTESDIAAYGKRRWRRVQYVADQFWSRWKTFYLQELQTRQKWTRKCRSLEKGDIVLVKCPSKILADGNHCVDQTEF